MTASASSLPRSHLPGPFPRAVRDGLPALLTGLPRLLHLRVVYRVQTAGSLPALPTTSFHGALAKAAWREVCVAPARPACRGCPAQPACAYARLFEPARVLGGKATGVTDEAPRPLVIAPEAPHLPTGSVPIPVALGEEVAFRVVVAGDPDGMHLALVRALRRAGRNGIGQGRFAVRLDLLDASRGDAFPLVGKPPASVRVEILTPLRIKAGGRIRSQLSAADLTDTLFRRARLIAFSAGVEWKASIEPAVVAGGLHIESSLRVISVRRHSARQGRQMNWPGVMGSLRLRGPGLRDLWPLLRFGELVQIGKATTFGFGRYRLVVPRGEAGE